MRLRTGGQARCPQRGETYTRPGGGTAKPRAKDMDAGQVRIRKNMQSLREARTALKRHDMWTRQSKSG